MTTSGVVKYRFFEAWEVDLFHGEISHPGPPKETGTVYTQYDAGSAYRVLREKHPNLDACWLSVSVVPVGEITPKQRRAATAKRLLNTSLKPAEGQHPITSIIWRGLLPDVPFTEGVQPLSLAAKTERNLELIAQRIPVMLETLQAFETSPRLQWQKAPGAA